MMVASDHLNPQEFGIEELLSAYSTEYDSPVRGVESWVTEKDKDYGQRGYLNELTSDVKEHGVREPVQLLSPVPGEAPEPMLVDGHHRVMAAKRAGLSHVPGVLHPVDTAGDLPRWPSFEENV